MGLPWGPALFTSGMKFPSLEALLQIISKILLLKYTNGSTLINTLSQFIKLKKNGDLRVLQIKEKMSAFLEEIENTPNMRLRGQGRSTKESKVKADLLRVVTEA